ncbi:Cytochrome P450 CYP6 [Frankliniella occidentalis]|uniref:Cytochrome P450 6k1 isoform X1 n=1 Tax=Frankliniella occidentalis TaxID=133901 RepID=A0A6J1TJ28_FRAOC|nr:cytochrome P450 6k1 isoform X1 [Frankliniella occidentalis]KAE8742072.1 Cytochrome P450 CYP6 [Frankliniella occidentalis]
MRLVNNTMVLLPWISVVAAVTAALVAYVKWAQSYWWRRGVVQTRPRLLGDLWDQLMRRRTAGDVIQSICRKHAKEPFVGIYNITTPILVVKEPELINEVLVKNFKSFANNETVIPEGADRAFGYNPFFAASHRWKELRLRLSRAFNPSRVKIAFSDMATSADCLAHLIAGSEPGTSHNGLLLAKRYTAHVSARVLFGIESHSLEIGSQPGVFYEMGHKIFNCDFLQNIRLMVFIYYRPLSKLIGYNIVSESIVDFFRKLIRDSVEYRHREGVTREDFVEHAAKTIMVDGKVAEDQLSKLAGQAINSYVETFETSGITLASVLLMLATNPAQQERVRAELKEKLKPGEPLEHDAVVGLPFLEQVVNETMRLFPFSDTMRRMCTKATTLRSAEGPSVLVEEGTAVYIPVETVHRDPAYYSHPEDFWPDHFSPEESEGRPKSVYLGFGDGPRQCPGMKYGTLQVKVALATVLQRFEVLPGEKQVLPVQRDPMAGLLNYKGGIWLKFRALAE